VVSAKLQRVVSLLSRLPGVGEKTAQRYVLHLLTTDATIARELGAELATLRDHVKPCDTCGNLADVEHADDPAVCRICSDGKRDSSILCIVAKVHDLMAIERAGTMRGRYFVLGKLLSPLGGVGPEDLPLAHVAREVVSRGVKEVIVATPPSVDGEATALLLKRELGPLSVRITRIASGVPHGGDIEFADPITMGRALTGRQQI